MSTPRPSCGYITRKNTMCQKIVMRDSQRCFIHQYDDNYVVDKPVTERCQGLTKSGELCKRTTGDVSRLCSVHRTIIGRCPFQGCIRTKKDIYCSEHEGWVEKSKRCSTECSICLDEANEIDAIECGHRFHHTCLSKFREFICPQCRCSLKHLPKSIVIQIERNKIHNLTIDHIMMGY